MPTLEELRPQLGVILQEHPDRYWLSYQILEELRVVAPNMLQQIEKRHGTAVGLGGGWQYGPASAISQCLGHWDMVDTQHIHAKGLHVGDTEASGDEMAIFRWRS